jgi:5-methylcytosine-specific restriction endonuclease McrA
MIQRPLRAPPRPPHERGDGCPMCGEKPTAKRARWHSVCVELWKLAAWPAVQLGHLIKTHGHICWGCGARDRALELEHIRPLWSLTDPERLELKWWLPYNLQLLCRLCHATKTADEARDRYAMRNPDGSLAKKRRAAEQQIPLELAS